MDFSSLGVGSPIYILNKADKPTLSVGVVKERTAPQPKYPAQATAGAFSGMPLQQVVTVTATVGDKEVVYADVPSTIEIAQRGTEVFSASREAMLQHVDGMMQTSRKALDMEQYHKTVLSEGEKMLETLNPRYAEEKRQARTITSLEERQHVTDAKLTTLEKQNAEILVLLRQITTNNEQKQKTT